MTYTLRSDVLASDSLPVLAICRRSITSVEVCVKDTSKAEGNELNDETSITLAIFLAGGQNYGNLRRVRFCPPPPPRGLRELLGEFDAKSSFDAR